ncbi:MAG: alpha/beta fold hydrolase, partial [Stellaceae bacterium]
MPALQRVVEIDGIPIHYLDAGGGPAILFLHGAGGAPPAGASFVSMLAARHRVLLPSRPGFDETRLGSCRSVEDVVRVVAGFVRAVADGPVHVVAQSAGGAVGSWLAILEPQLVQSLILSAPAAFAPHGTRPPPREQLEEILYGPNPAWSAPPTDADRQRIARNAAGNIGRWTDADAARLLPRLGEIAAPALLLWA